MTLNLEGVVDDGIGPISLRFEHGLYTLLGDTLAPLACLSEILAGVRRPRRGRALLDDHNVYDAPNARRAIASLLPTEVALPAACVSDALELAARLHGAPLNGKLVLDRAGLSRFAALPPERLGPREQRALALALALARDDGKVWLLHDPFSLHALVSKASIVARCREVAARGCVLVTTTRLEEAIELGGSVWRIERGRPAPPVLDAPISGSHASIVVRSEHAEHLAELCASEPGIQYVWFDAQRSPREVLLFGPELSALARAALNVARSSNVTVDALAPLAPPSASARA